MLAHLKPYYRQQNAYRFSSMVCPPGAQIPPLSLELEFLTTHITALKLSANRWIAACVYINLCVYESLNFEYIVKFSSIVGGKPSHEWCFVIWLNRKSFTQAYKLSERVYTNKTAAEAFIVLRNIFDRL